MTDCVATTPLAIASDHNLLMKMNLKWKLKNNVMVPAKVKNSYANLRRLPQFSDDTTTAVNNLTTNHILQNYTLDPALGLQNYSIFSAAVSNSIKLNMSQHAFRLSDMYTAQQEQYLYHICDDIDSLVADKQAKLAWAKINKLTGRKCRSN